MDGLDSSWRAGWGAEVVAAQEWLAKIQDDAWRAIAGEGEGEGQGGDESWGELRRSK